MATQYLSRYISAVHTNGVRLKASEPLIVDTGGTVTLPATTTIGGSSVSALGVITSSSANALTVGPNGTTNPSFNVDASTASAATGLNVKSAAAASGLAVSVVSSGTNENLTVNAKGSGTITFGNTSTGNVNSVRKFNAMSATTLPAGGATGQGIQLFTTTNLGVFAGSGVPTLSAAQGALYLRSDGSSTSTRLYVNTDGGTTWTNVTTAA